jgi:hypothetical protein
MCVFEVLSTSGFECGQGLVEAFPKTMMYIESCERRQVLLIYKIISAVCFYLQEYVQFLQSYKFSVCSISKFTKSW